MDKRYFLSQLSEEFQEYSTLMKRDFQVIQYWYDVTNTVLKIKEQIKNEIDYFEKNEQSHVHQDMFLKLIDEMLEQKRIDDIEN